MSNTLTGLPSSRENKEPIPANAGMRQQMHNTLCKDCAFTSDLCTNIEKKTIAFNDRKLVKSCTGFVRLLG
jgi:hypothetical protein